MPKIEVLQKDIDESLQNHSSKCVVAHAIARSLKDAHHIEVDMQTIRFTDGSTDRRLQYLTPFAVQGYVVAFDAGDEIKPFSFSLRNPIKVSTRRRTEEGRARAREKQQARRERERTEESPQTAGAQVGETVEENEKDPAAEAKAAYHAATEEAAAAPTTEKHGDGPRSAPRTWKKKSRTYGARMLRINRRAEEPAPTS